MFSLIFLLCVAQIFAQNKPNDIVGKWLEADGKKIIEIYKAGNIYRAKIILYTSKNQAENDKRDVHNSNKKLRNRTILGLDIINGLTFAFADKNWIKGQYYNPETGTETECEVNMSIRNELILTPSVDLRKIVQKWRRYE